MITVKRTSPVISREDQGIGVLKLAKMLNRLGGFSYLLNHASDFRRSGNYRFTLEFSAAKLANKFVKSVWYNRTLINRDEIWVASVPLFRTTKRVILRAVDDDSVTPEELLKYMRPPTSWPQQ